jgi:hypothetical protein
MRAIKPNNRRRSLWSKVLLGFSALVIGGVGTVAALGALKVIDLQRLAFWRKPQPIPADWIAIPICAKPIPAYTAVTRDYLLSPMTGDWLMDHQPPEKVQALVKKGVITDIEKIRGRVTAREHGALFYFSENDFLPAGTRPGVVGGTPAGKRAITLDAGKLKGVHDLKEGDHLDLLASVPVDMPGAGRSGGRSGANVVVAPDRLWLPKRSSVSTLVQDGVVVTPVRVRNAPVNSTQGGSVRTTPVQEIVIAVDPEEVAPLAEAMDLKYEITCVARSGRPLAVAASVPNQSSGGLFPVLAALVKAVQTDGLASGSEKAKHAPDGAETASRSKIVAAGGKQGPSDITPGFDPMAHTRYTEVMIGAQRQYVVFAGPGSSPVVALQEAGAAKAEPEVRPATATEETKQ